MTLLDSPGGGGFQNPVAQLLPGQVTSADIADGAITSIKLANDLQSDNFVVGVSGWRIQRNTGNAEFNNVTVRGTVTASTISGSTVTGTTITGGTIRTAATGARLQLTGGNRFFEVFNASNNAVARFGYDATGFGSTDVVIANLGTIGSLILSSQGIIELRAEGSAGFGVMVTNPDPAGGAPGQPFYVAGPSGNTGHGFTVWDSVSAATPTWAFALDDDTGIRRAATNDIRPVAGGTDQASFNATDMRLFGINNTTTAAAANVFINSSSGLMARSTSSAQYKTDIRPWDRRHNILALTPSLFRSKANADDSRRTHLGLIAEDVQTNFPLAFIAPDAINWNAIIAGLLCEIQAIREELNARHN